MPGIRTFLSQPRLPTCWIIRRFRGFSLRLGSIATDEFASTCLGAVKQSGLSPLAFNTSSGFGTSQSRNHRRAAEVRELFTRQELDKLFGDAKLVVASAWAKWRCGHWPHTRLTRFSMKSSA